MPLNPVFLTIFQKLAELFASGRLTVAEVLDDLDEPTARLITDQAIPRLVPKMGQGKHKVTLAEKRKFIRRAGFELARTMLPSELADAVRDTHLGRSVDEPGPVMLEVEPQITEATTPEQAIRITRDALLRKLF